MPRDRLLARLRRLEQACDIAELAIGSLCRAAETAAVDARAGVGALDLIESFESSHREHRRMLLALSHEVAVVRGELVRLARSEGVTFSEIERRHHVTRRMLRILIQKAERDPRP